MTAEPGINASDPQPLTLVEMVEADRADRLARGAERIQQVLKEERLDLIAVPAFTADGRTVATAQLVALP